MLKNEMTELLELLWSEEEIEESSVAPLSGDMPEVIDGAGAWRPVMRPALAALC